MIRKMIYSIFLMIHTAAISLGGMQDRLTLQKYHTPDEVSALLQSWASEYPRLVKTTVIGRSAGRSELIVLQIAARPEGSVNPDARPAVFVSANIEGVHLVGTEAALIIIEKLLTQYGSNPKITSLLDNRIVYVAPLLNPDAAKRYFTSPAFELGTNSTPRDDDADGRIDEDGPEDLNGDGFITQMRVKDRAGAWIPDPGDPRLMRKADPQKGEAGIYRIFTEGKDDDHDGRYNEDPAGGIDLSRNFPHLLQYNRSTINEWPDSAPETLAVVKFLIDHPNIGLILDFSTTNTMLAIPQTFKKKTDKENIKISKTLAGVLGLDPDESHAMTTLLEAIRRKNLLPPGRESDESAVMQLLGFDPPVTVEAQDLIFLKTVQSDYISKYNQITSIDQNMKTDTLDSGSFIAFCYLRYGAPVVSTDVWRIPTPKTAFANDHPDAPALKWSDEILKGRGFINWKPFKHPTLDEVEIGGFVPFAAINPPPEESEADISFHADYYLDLMNHSAEVEIGRTQVRAVEDSIYRVTVQFHNPGWFPTSTAQGRKARVAWPITVRLKTAKDQMIWAGEPFEVIAFIGGGETRTLEWKIKGKRGSTFDLSATYYKTVVVKTTIELK